MSIRVFLRTGINSRAICQSPLKRTSNFRFPIIPLHPRKSALSAKPALSTVEVSASHLTGLENPASTPNAQITNP
ncbi:MAG: hypothetical protein ISR59_07160 [Anaerolineales bacterium]|uniref:Uncharacterized protein n=1 Tax=Candidatus Desulfolinea nitratireducens TaxID=2841698 RepID=A0A8J6THQ9_9CHLR|nr:hypothetical protein [Candidatus Desulfolinea nitratireducens]MBL6960872.1 hypothetical protein [Anaerolineales bacterium]